MRDSEPISAELSEIQRLKKQVAELKKRAAEYQENMFGDSGPDSYVNPAPILEVDAENVIMWSNPAATALFQRNLVGCRWSQIFPDIVPPNLVESVDHEFPRFEHIIGEQHYLFNIKKHPSRLSHFIFGSDITMWKQTEQTLREREARLTSIFLAAPTGIGVVVNRVFKQVNDVFCSMLGYTPDELIDQNSRIVYPSQEEYERVGRIKYEDIRKTGTGTIETKMIRKDSAILDVLLSSAPLDMNDYSVGITFTALDITDRKEAEEHLRESQRFNENITKATPDIIFIIDVRENRTIYSNRQVENLLGYTAGEIRSMGDKYSELLFHPDDLETYRRRIASYDELADGDTRSIDYRLKARNGSWRWFQATAGIFERDPDGSVRLIIGTAKDITDRKLAEEAVRRSEAKMRNILESSPDAITVVDMEGRIVECNQVMLTMLGIDARNDLIGSRAVDFVDEKQRETAARNMARVFENDLTQSQEYDLHTRDGRVIPCEISASTMRDESGNPVGQVAILKDITDRRQAEKDITESRERFLRLAEASFEGIGIHEKGVIIDANAQLARMLGYDLPELIGKSVMDFVAPESQPVVTGRMQSDSEATYEHMARRKDGTTFPVEIHRRQLPYEGRRVWVTAIRDLTERKKFEEEIKKNAKQLKAEREALVEKNITLRQVLNHLEKEKENYKHSLCANVENLIAPTIDKLRKSNGYLLGKDIDLLEEKLNSIIGKDIDIFKNNYSKLTSREIETCDGICNGLTSKEIADNFNISVETVHKHRESIRKKLNITHKNINLAAYLRSKRG